jgi:hypothetical protein
MRLAHQPAAGQATIESVEVHVTLSSLLVPMPAVEEGPVEFAEACGDSPSVVDDVLGTPANPRRWWPVRVHRRVPKVATFPRRGAKTPVVVECARARSEFPVELVRERLRIERAPAADSIDDLRVRRVPAAQGTSNSSMPSRRAAMILGSAPALASVLDQSVRRPPM